MKKLLFILAVMFLPFTANAQSELWGDMNNDGTVSIADVMKLVDIVLLGHPGMTISPSSVTIPFKKSVEVTISGGSNLFEVTSLNTNVVKASLSGRKITLTGISSGETKVLVKDTYTKKYSELTVVVESAPLQLSENDIFMSTGDEYQ